jgi:phosphoenolpyruvate carboxykinase (GTP)
MIKRVDGTARGVPTPIGTVPAKDQLNLKGLDLGPAQLEELLAVDNAGWQAELASAAEYLETFAPRLPERLRQEYRRVAAALATDAPSPHTATAH